MKYPRNFFKCEHCGNIIAMINSSGVKVKCCGDTMVELKPNTVDASEEKHIPAAKRDGNKLTVDIGAVIHPMTDEHHIEWICVAQEHKTQMVTLDKTGKPSATFDIDDGDATVYDYCNLHALWATEL